MTQSAFDKIISLYEEKEANAKVVYFLRNHAESWRLFTVEDRSWI